jgi:hypothetical protein
MKKISINVNLGFLMGTIRSEFRTFKSETKTTCEFDLEVKNYNSKQVSPCTITCVSEGVQAELILKRKRQGDDVLVTGYIGDVDLGQGTTRFGHHKFRITGVHFKYLNVFNFSGRILTQPSQTKTGAVEFYLGTYRFHESVPLQPCKIRIICEGKLAKIMLAFKEIKTVGEYMQILGFLDIEDGNHVIRAKRLELLLPNAEKEPVFNQIKEEAQNERAREGSNLSRDQGNSDHSSGDKGSSDGEQGAAVGDVDQHEGTAEAERSAEGSSQEAAAANQSDG